MNTNTWLWVLQGLLAAAFILTAVRKFVRSDDDLRALPWARGMTPAQVRGIGVLELLGGLGVVLPALTGILPWLTPLAAIGLGLLMIGAAVTNVRAGLYRPIAANAILFLMAAAVVAGRFAPVTA